MRRDVIRIIILVAAVATLVVIGGCAGRKVPKVDVSAGEYYAEDDYAKLSGRRKSQYCNELENELNARQAEFERKTIQLQDMKDLIESIRKQIIPLERDVIRLDAEIRTLNDQVREVKSLPREWVVKPDDTLTLIAMKKNIYNDIDKWWKIFEANIDKIHDPYYIFPDTVLVLPRDWPVD
jgi:nucleoid-associated protein YgaU